LGGGGGGTPRIKTQRTKPQPKGRLWLPSIAKTRQAQNHKGDIQPGNRGTIDQRYNANNKRNISRRITNTQRPNTMSRTGGERGKSKPRAHTNRTTNIDTNDNTHIQQTRPTYKTNSNARVGASAHATQIHNHERDDTRKKKANDGGQCCTSRVVVLLYCL
jgi:hypothetical protein